MDLRLGLSLLLLLTYSSSIQSKNIRDGPKARSRHTKRATPSEYLKPPAPIGKNFNHHPSTNLAPPPFILPPPGAFRNGKFIDNSRHPGSNDSKGYFSRLMTWLNPWSTGNNNGPPPAQQTLRKPTAYPPEEQRSVPLQGPFNPDRRCNPCNEEPWIPIRSIASQPYPQNFNDGRYLPSSPSHEIRQPDFTYSPPQNAYPPAIFTSHPIPNPHMYPGAMPPLYKATQFSSAGSDSHSASNIQIGKFAENPPPLDNGSASTNIQVKTKDHVSEPEVDDSRNPELDHHHHPATTDRIQGQESQIQSQGQHNGGKIEKLPVDQEHHLEGQFQGSFGQKIQAQDDPNRIKPYKEKNSPLEIIPSIGGQVSSEQIHFERSPIIDLSVSPSPLTPLLTETHPTNKFRETSTKPSSLIDYLVAGYDDRIPISQSTRPIIDTTESGEIDYYNSPHSQEELGYNEKQPFLESFMESYYNFKRQEEADSKVSATNSANSGFSSGDNLQFTAPSSRTGKKNKQVQIIIPYTSQFTPSPFHSSIIDHVNRGEIEQQLPRKVPSDVHYDPFDEGVVAQESNTVSVTSLPDVHSTSSAPLKNNSIDVQRLQKNIDNWTIQEYSKGLLPSTVTVPNATHPHLSRSKNIPNEYFLTKQLNSTSEEIYDDEGAKHGSSEFDFEDYKQMTTFEISRVTPEPTKMVKNFQSSNENDEKQIETKENEVSPSKNESDIKDVFKIGTIFANATTNKKGEKVYVVTPLPIGEKELKKAFEIELKKKPKKKEIEKIERAYQVLPQAVNNLAVASTGPESVPLWGIMEHEEYASSNLDTETQLPVLYTGHSKVSHARR